MTPKEKAVELFSDYRYISSIPNAPLGELKDYMAKQCSLRAVNEILDSYGKEKSYGYIISDKIIPYWEQVKEEINKL